MIEIIVAMFMGVCAGTAPMDAEPMYRNPDGGWPVHGYVVDLGWHDVVDGAVLIQQHLGSSDYIVWATNQVPPEIQVGATRIFHPTCGAYIVKNPTPPVRLAEPDWRCTTIVDGRVKFLSLEVCA